MGDSERQPYTQSGFTIVELLVVIVVVGILALITMVSYTGITQKAKVALLKSDLANAAKTVQIDQTQASDSGYPTSLSAINGGRGLTGSGGTTWQYQADNTVNPKTFCITATNNGLSYYIDQGQLPTLGGCPGDIVAGSPALSNPSYESDTAGNGNYPLQWNQYGGTADTYEGVSSDYAKYGTKSFKISQSSGSDMDGGVWARVSGLTLGQTVTVSAWVKTSSDVANANFVLCTNQNGLSGSEEVYANQGPSVNHRVSATLYHIDQTAVDIFIGLGSWGSLSHGNAWFDGFQVNVSDPSQGPLTITDANFESTAVGNSVYPVQWNPYGGFGNVYQGVASDYAYNGTHSFKISQSGSDMDGGIWTRISGLAVGKKVTVSAWVKTGAGVSNANLVLTTFQYGLTGSQSAATNVGQNANGRYSVTLNSIDTTSVDLYIGQGSFGSQSQGTVWFDDLQLTVE